MTARKKAPKTAKNSSANLGFERKLWLTANFGWMQHFIHRLAPNGIARFVLANGSMSFNQSGESDRLSQAVQHKSGLDTSVFLN